MSSQQKRVYPWKYAAFGGMAFAVVLSIFVFLIFLSVDILFPPPESIEAFSFAFTQNQIFTIALSYLVNFLFALIIGLFVFVRLLRTRLTLIFVLTQAVILWFLLLLLTLFPIVTIMVVNPSHFPWEDVFFNADFIKWQFKSLISWLIPVGLTFGFLRVLKII